MPVPVLLLTIGAVLVGSIFNGGRSKQPDTSIPLATRRQRGYLAVLLGERDDADKFVAPDDPELSKWAASRLIRRLEGEREQRRYEEDFGTDRDYADAVFCDDADDCDGPDGSN